MSADCFCALCCGPLGIYRIKFGSKRAKHLRRRRRRVTVKQRRLRGEPVHEDSFDRLAEDGTTQVFVNGGHHRVVASKHVPREWEVGAGADPNRDLLVENDDIDMPDAPPGQEQHDSDGDDTSDSDYNATDEEDTEDDADNASWDSEEDQNEALEWDEDDEVIHELDGNNGIQDVDVPPASDEEEDLTETLSQASELSQEHLSHLYSRGDDTRSMFDYDEKHAYDPERLTLEDVKWVDRCRVLTINRDLEEGQRAYISGRGRFDDYFQFNVKNPGRDPRDSGKTDLSVYHAYEPQTDDTGFPIHEACLNILLRRLGYANLEELDQDIMYEVMMQNVEELASRLNIDYGGIEGADQFWECYAGEEYAASDPSEMPDIVETIQEMLPTGLFSSPDVSAFNLSHKVKNDPLAKLPYDILHNICSSLDMSSTLSLVKASWHVFDSTRHPAFWRHMVRCHITTFFFELREPFRTMTLPESFDWRGLFQWLDKITKTEYGMQGPLMNIANRRRIWNTCAALVPQYFDKLLAEVYTEPSPEEAAQIFSRALSYHTPVTTFPYPQADHGKDISTLMVRSWEEIDYRACDLETYFTDSHGTLTGISFRFGTVERLFGRKSNVKGSALHIGAGEWIKEITATFRNVGIDSIYSRKQEITGRGDPQTLHGSGISSLRITLNNGTSKRIKYGGAESNSRTYSILPGMHFVGFTGRITSDGTISRFGILQASRPCDEQAPVELNTPAHQMLWGARSWLYHNPTRQHFYMYNHPTYQIRPFSSESPPNKNYDGPFIPKDMLPWQTFLWRNEPNMAQSRDGIHALQLNGSVLGLASKAPKTGTYPEHTGNQGPVAAMIPDRWHKVSQFKDLDLWDQMKAWPEQYMRHFVVDFPGGENITEVHASQDKRAFKLVTNRGREGVFGRDVGTFDSEWEVVKPGEGEIVVGLVLCFGEPQCWSESMQMWSHMAMTDLCVVVARQEEAGSGTDRTPA